jgi:hypothetical protein
MSVETNTLTGSVYEVDRYTSYGREGATSPNFLLGDGGVNKGEVGRERGWWGSWTGVTAEHCINQLDRHRPKTRTLCCGYRLG